MFPSVGEVTATRARKLCDQASVGSVMFSGTLASVEMGFSFVKADARDA